MNRLILTSALLIATGMGSALAEDSRGNRGKAGNEIGRRDGNQGAKIEAGRREAAAKQADVVRIEASQRDGRSYLGYGGNDIDRREANQAARIEAGRRDGSLTGREARALQAEQDRIHALEREAKRDGRIDPREAARIREAQQDASRHIYQERHDRDTRGSRYFGWWGGRRY